MLIGCVKAFNVSHTALVWMIPMGLYDLYIKDSYGVEEILFGRLLTHRSKLNSFQSAVPDSFLRILDLLGLLGIFGLRREKIATDNRKVVKLNQKPSQLQLDTLPIFTQKKERGNCFVWSFYFFLNSSAPTMAIAMIMAITATAM
jgi:hypothetical protein